jgi:probable phosphoglycerate mutase
MLELAAGVTLYLARHGETEANSQHRFSGKRDTPLTQKGLAQAHALGEIMKREVGMRPSLAFVASPLARARLTMQIVRGVLGLPEGDFATDARIAEIDLGAWDQLTDEEARARNPALFDARAADKLNIPVPGGDHGGIQRPPTRAVCDGPVGPVGPTKPGNPVGPVAPI